MAIPWVTALHLARKWLPVVIEKTPDLLKTFERFRSAPTQDATSADPELAALLEQIEHHQRTIATQADSIVQLERRLGRAKRSIAVAWILLAAMLVISITIITYLLFRS